MFKLKKYIFCTVLLILGAMTCGHVNGQNLNKHRWEERVLIIQASDTSSEIFQGQLREFSDSEKGLEERKLIVYQIVGDKYKVSNSKMDKSDKGWKVIDGKTIKALDVEVPFKVTLIGLDGGIKLERTAIFKKKELFRIIDAMPMRLSELRNRNRNN